MNPIPSGPVFRSIAQDNSVQGRLTASGSSQVRPEPQRIYTFSPESTAVLHKLSMQNCGIERSFENLSLSNSPSSYTDFSACVEDNHLTLMFRVYNATDSIIRTLTIRSTTSPSLFHRTINPAISEIAPNTYAFYYDCLGTPPSRLLESRISRSHYELEFGISNIIPPAEHESLTVYKLPPSERHNFSFSVGNSRVPVYTFYVQDPKTLSSSSDTIPVPQIIYTHYPRSNSAYILLDGPSKEVSYRKLRSLQELLKTTTPHTSLDSMTIEAEPAPEPLNQSNKYYLLVDIKNKSKHTLSDIRIESQTENAIPEEKNIPPRSRFLQILSTLQTSTTNTWRIFITFADSQETMDYTVQSKPRRTPLLSSLSLDDLEEALEGTYPTQRPGRFFKVLKLNITDEIDENTHKS